MKSFILILILILSVNSCKETKSIYVADQLVDCVGVAPQKCMLVKENLEDQWENFYGKIHGFEYQEGYRYLLKVSVEKIKNPPADASNLKYTLIEVLEKEKTESQMNLTNKWKVIELEGIDKLNENPTMNFEDKDHRISGSSGCNNYFGSYKLDNNKLTFSQMGSTRKMCPDMSIENLFMNNLREVDHYQIKNDRLILFSDDDKKLFVCEVIE